MKMSMKIMLSSALILLTAVPAFAVSTTIDFTGSAGVIGYSSQPYTISAGAFSADLSAWSLPGGGSVSQNAPFSGLTQEKLHQDSDGMGVYSYLGDSTQLDAGGRLDRDEVLTVDLGEDVILEAVHFSLATGDDEFDMAVDNVDIGITALFGTDVINDLGAPQYGNGISYDYIVDFTSARIIGTMFQFYTDDWCDGYKIVGITVTEVPEPATMGLLGIAALSGLALRRKQRGVEA
jgi:hypothetical protein